MFSGIVSGLAIDSQPDLYGTNCLAVQLNARDEDLVEVLVSFQASGTFRWYLQAANCTMSLLSDPSHFCSSAQTQTYTKVCCLVVGSTGLLTLTLAVQALNGSTPNLTNLKMSARQVGVVSAPPSTAPQGVVWFDPQNWIETVDDLKSYSSKWVPGYKVRYAVSLYNSRGEGPQGPWCDWIQGEPWAMPTLINVPVGLNGLTTGRKIYRQFEGHDVELVGTIANNTDTRFGDGTP